MTAKYQELMIRSITLPYFPSIIFPSIDKLASHRHLHHWNYIKFGNSQRQCCVTYTRYNDVQDVLTRHRQTDLHDETVHKKILIYHCEYGQIQLKIPQNQFIYLLDTLDVELSVKAIGGGPGSFLQVKLIFKYSILRSEGFLQN